MTDRHSVPDSATASAALPAAALPDLPAGRMAVLFAVMLVAAAGNTAMQSVLPAIGTRLGLADVWVSLAFSWSALLWVLTAPRWARLSDRRGRKALMQLGLVGFSTSMMTCGLILWAGLSGWIGAGVCFALFAVFRSLYGVLGSAAPPAVQAYVAARTDVSQRTASLSVLASSFGLGTVIGPAIAPFLILPLFGLSGPMLAFAAIGVGVMVALRLVLPDDTPAHAARGSVSGEPLSGAGSSGAAAWTGDGEPLPWTDRRIRPWLVAGLLGGHANAMLLGVIGFVVLDRLDLRATPELATDPTGLVLMAGAGATLLAQWGLIPGLQLTPRVSVMAGAGLATVGVSLVGAATGLHGLVVGFAVASLGFGLFRPGFTAGTSLAVGAEAQGSVAGKVTSVNGMAYIVAPAVAVLIHDWNAPVVFWLIGALTAGLALWSVRGLGEAA